MAKLVKTTVALRADVATLRRQEHGQDRGRGAPSAFVIWSRSRRQVAAAVGFSHSVPCNCPFGSGTPEHRAQRDGGGAAKVFFFHFTAF